MPPTLTEQHAPGRDTVEIVNCHVHTFTQAHTPKRFLPWPVTELVRLPVVRRLLFWAARLFDRERRGRLGRYAQIIQTSYNKTQREVFEVVRGFYPQETRFIVLPMDMTEMNAGPVEAGIDAQHTELAALRDAYPDSKVIPFAAVDPRHDGIVEKTIALRAWEPRARRRRRRGRRPGRRRTRAARTL
jgi:hypothetical protein